MFCKLHSVALVHVNCKYCKFYSVDFRERRLYTDLYIMLAIVVITVFIVALLILWLGSLRAIPK